MTEYFPNQPDYMRISPEDSCNTLMQKLKTDGLTDHHKAEHDVGDDYADVKVTKCGEG